MGILSDFIITGLFQGMVPQYFLFVSFKTSSIKKIREPQILGGGVALTQWKCV